MVTTTCERLMAGVIDSTRRHLCNADDLEDDGYLGRVAFYSEMIQLFDEHGGGALVGCVGLDAAFDDALMSDALMSDAIAEPQITSS